MQGVGSLQGPWCLAGSLPAAGLPVQQQQQLVRWASLQTPLQQQAGPQEVCPPPGNLLLLLQALQQQQQELGERPLAAAAAHAAQGPRALQEQGVAGQCR